jgi:hypothetical protein
MDENNDRLQQKQRKVDAMDKFLHSNAGKNKEKVKFPIFPK